MTDELDRFIARKFGRRDSPALRGRGGGRRRPRGLQEGDDRRLCRERRRPPPIRRSRASPATSRCSTGPGTGAASTTRTRRSRTSGPAYQKATGDTPKFILFANDDDGYTKTAAGSVNFDVIHPCAYRFKDYVDLGAVQPWDTSLDPQLRAAEPEARDRRADRREAVLHRRGLGVHRAAVPSGQGRSPTEDSWSLLWDDRYAGKISWINTLEMLVIAGYYHGVSDPWTMTDDELGQMRDFLISKKHLVSFMWDQSYDLWRPSRRGTSGSGTRGPTPSATPTAAGMDVVYMQPKEGRIWWSCGFGLFAEHRELPPRARLRGLLVEHEGGASSSRATTTTGTRTPRSTCRRSRRRWSRRSAWTIRRRSRSPRRTSSPGSPAASVYAQYWTEVLGGMSRPVAPGAGSGVRMGSARRRPSPPSEAATGARGDRRPALRPAAVAAAVLRRPGRLRRGVQRRADQGLPDRRRRRLARRLARASSAGPSTSGSSGSRSGSRSRSRSSSCCSRTRSATSWRSASKKRKYVLLLLIIAPFLTSYLLRVLAWKVILGDSGVINSLPVLAPSPEPRSTRSRGSSTASSR